MVVHTGGYGGAGRKHRQQALPLQVEEMLLLHLKELLLNGDLLGCQLQAIKKLTVSHSFITIIFL